MEPTVTNDCPKQGITTSNPIARGSIETRLDTPENEPSGHEYHILSSRSLESPPALSYSNSHSCPIAEDMKKVANPAPLGLCAFALTSFVMNLYNVYMPSASASGITVALPLVYGGLAQILVGMWEMAVGNTFGAVTFCSYGSYWVASAIITWLDDIHATGGNEIEVCQKHLLMAFYMMAWFIFTTLMLLCTLKSSLAMFLLFFFLDMSYLLLGISHFQCEPHGGAQASVEKVGGLFGVLAALAAWYNALAGVANAGNGFFGVPVGHFPWSPVSHAHRAKVKAV